MAQSLRERLLRYLQRQQTWIAKGEIERLVIEKTTFTADNTGRRLRELAEEGLLEVKQVRGHSFYKSTKKLTDEEFWNSIT